MDLFWWQLGVDILALLGIAVVILVLVLPVLLGAPYVPIQAAALERLLALAGVRPGEKAVDLGSGDGRIVMALARAGAEAHGYEINPLLVWLARRNIRRAGLSGRAFIHWKSFRLAPFSRFGLVTVYGLKSIMKELEGKLQSELPPGGRVVSHIFKFPNWPVKSGAGGVYLYVR